MNLVPILQVKNSFFIQNSATTFRFYATHTIAKKMTHIERGKALAMLSVALSIREVARRMGRAKASIHALKEKERSDSVRAWQTTPGRGRRNLASLGEVKMIRMVKASPFMAAKKIKDKMGRVGQVQPQENSADPPEGWVQCQAHCKQPLLTDRMKAARMEFATSHLHWTAEDWCKISYTDESTFRLVRGAPATSGGARAATGLARSSAGPP